MLGKTLRRVGVALLLSGTPQAAALIVAARPALAETSPASPGFDLDGVVRHPRSYRLSDLRALPATSLRVYFNTGSGPTEATFTGVLLWTLLEAAEVGTEPAKRNDLLRRTLHLTAPDGHEVALSVGEIAPAYGGEQALVAIAEDGRPLPDEEGIARLVMPGDKAGGRNIFAIARIEVR